ncbi:MFS transporter, partial [Escherichia coli]|uniref:MFS transporter n=1 Tax=Escherichia coli TaxID=562 RepID=UPI0015BC6976
RRPFIALGSLLLAGLLAALFAPPELPPELLAFWFAFSLLALSLAWTLVDVPWEALGPEICRDYDERSALFSLREGAAVLGLLLARGAPMA